MTRRVSGLVKQRRRRAQKRADIRAGRKMSMQQMLQNTHNHNHQEVEAPMMLVQEGIEPGATHILVQRTTSLVDGKEVEAEIFRGTEGQMRKERNVRKTVDPEGTYTVRKIKVPV
jgi:hypothetical protein